MRLFGTSGIRGVIGEELTSAFIMEVGMALGTTLPVQSQVCVATDTRLSGDMVKSSLTAGILSAGVNVIDAGVLPTPVLAYTARALNAPGVMVTASHNPPQFNGIKLWNPSTKGYSREQEEEIEKTHGEKSYRKVGWESLGQLQLHETAGNDYINDMKERLSVDTDLTVVVDPGNGAASRIAAALFRTMGVTVFPVNDEPDGTFPNRASEPKAETLAETVNYLREVGADFAICFDGDADRVVFCDEEGFIGYNEMIAYISYVQVKQSEKKTVATTVETGRLLDHAVEKAGGRVVRGRVGDVAVAELVKELDACLGVEQVGVYIFPEIGMHPDTLYASLLLLKHVTSPRDIRTFLSSLPEMHFAKESMQCPHERKGQVMGRMKEAAGNFNPGEVNSLDGIRLEFSDAWLLIRPSGTEPIIRIIGESESQPRLRSLMAKGREAVQKALQVGV